MIKQPNGTLSRMYVQTYTTTSEARNECSLECTSLIPAGL